jgi:Tol biopolymer transport system component
MNQRDDLDRKLMAWLDDPFTPPAPGYLGEVLARTRHTRQRRSWASLERWLPMTITLRRPMLAPPMRLLAIGLALILALLGAMALAPILSSPSRLPAAVTSWSNGLVAFDRVGDIWVVDPEVGEPRLLIGGMTADEGPDWSPDGTKIAFLRPDGLAHGLMVADADGSNVTKVTTDPIIDLQTYAWSPDGTQLAMASSVRRYPTITLVEADGSGSRKLDVGVPVDWVTWHPDGTSLLVRAGTPDGTSLFSVSLPDGALSKPIITSDTTSEFYAGDRGINDLLWPTWSPDGSHIAYTNGQAAAGSTSLFGGPDLRNFVVDADGSGTRMVQYAADSDYEDGATWSPDGSRLSMVIRTGGYHQIAIADMVGDDPIVVTTPEDDPAGIGHVWSPDGTMILTMRDADEVTAMVDTASGARTQQAWLGGPLDWQPVAVQP